MRSLPLIVLRPEPGASVTVGAARALGLDARACPLFAITPLTWTPPAADDFEALVLTSANAVRHAGAQLAQYAALPVHAVGAATAAAAREAGFRVVSDHDGGAQALLDGLGSVCRLLWLCGADRTAIDPRGRTIAAVPVYAARAIDPPADFAALIVARSVALVHSARAGQRLADLVERRSPVAIAAISHRAALACGSGWARVVAAERPGGEAVLELARRMCQTSRGKDAAGQ